MFRSLFLFVLALCLSISTRAQNTTLTLCTEESLREALAAGGTVFIDCSSNIITLSSPIVISRSVLITTTNTALAISGNKKTRLFIVEPDVNFAIQNIALFSGRQTETNENNGGIPETAGAAIYNNGGRVTLLDLTLSSHEVVGINGANGANRDNGGDGEEGGDAAGAAIYNSNGTLLASNVLFSSNIATGGNGGKGGDGAGAFGGSGGNGGRGGSAGGAAIYSQGGRLEIYNCVFTNNQVTGSIAGLAGLGSGLFGFHGTPGASGEAAGGAISFADTTVLIYGSTFVNNFSKAANGQNGTDGLRNSDGGDGRPGGSASGGAIFATSPLVMTNCTFTSNTVTSGKGGNGGKGGTDFFGSDGGDGGNGGSAAGGALETTSTARVVNCTFVANTASAGTGGMGGTGSGLGKNGRSGANGSPLGGSIYNETGQLSIGNSIVATSVPANIAGVATDLGGNLSSDPTPLFVSSTSLINLNPLIRNLASNGGPTPTMALAFNSPAIDKGLVNLCPPIDQRGSNRFFRCDIGAYEFNGGLPVARTNISLASGRLTNMFGVSWSTNGTNLALHMTTNFPVENWILVTNTPLVTNNLNLVILPFTNNRVFFRLSTTNAP